MKTMKTLCCLCMGMLLMSLVFGCSDDESSENDGVEYEYDWTSGPEDYTIVQVNGYVNRSSFKNDNIAISKVVECPDVDHEILNSPPFGDSRIYFDPSDLNGEDEGNNDYVVLRVKKYRRVKMKGLVSQVAYDSHQYDCIVEPYHSTDVINNVNGTVRQASLAWYIVYEKDGSQCVVFPTNLDNSLKVEGLHVVFSGELYKKTGYWYEADNYDEIHRVRLTNCKGK